jgi:phosphohistidine swiveling domain-containing protein
VPRLQTLYRCTDGTPFPVTWDDPADAERPWVRSPGHWPDPLPPLEFALLRLGQPGADRAYAEVGLPVPYVFRRQIAANGYLFMDGRSMTPAEEAAMLPLVTALADRHGGALGVWEQYCLPRLHQAADAVLAAGPGADLAFLAETWAYGINQTQVSFEVIHAAQVALAQFCVSFAGQGPGQTAGAASVTPNVTIEAGRLSLELTAGTANLTIAADQALWELAEQVRANPVLVEAVAGCTDRGDLAALASLPGGPDFLAAFEAFLQRWGNRAQSWELLAPTWRERPATPLLLLRRFLTDCPPSPRAVMQASAADRDALVQATEARLANDSGRERFRALLAAASAYVTVREDRACWQLHMYGALRGAMLRRGEALVAEGRLDSAEDVLFLLPEELEPLARVAGLRGRIVERRAERERWRRLEPPMQIGAAPAPDPAAEPAPTGEPALAGELRGIGASRGTLTARARVIMDLNDADSLQPGEVLVCRMTSPPWTPLFALAGAVVTETGGLLSHTSIAAREYGIPCVVGMAGATRMLAGGALVFVDGGAGLVRIVEVGS